MSASPGLGGGVPSTWSPLRYPIFRWLFIAQLVSNIGSLMQTVGSVWLMGDLHASPTVVSLVQTAAFLPVMLLAVPAGAMADIVDRRLLLVCTQFGMAISAGLLAWLTFAGGIDPYTLLTLTFALGIGAALNTPAWAATQPDLVPKGEFSQAVALTGMTFNLGRSLGPALGGLVVALAGPGWVFGVNALSFVGTVVVLWRWRRQTSPRKARREGLLVAMRGTVRYAANAPMLRAVLFRIGVLSLVGSSFQTFLPLDVRGPLGLGSLGYGLIFGAFGAGAVVSAVLRPQTTRRFSPDFQLDVASVFLVAAVVGEGFVRVPWLVAVAAAVAGAAFTNSTVTANVSTLSVLPGWVRARGMGLYTLAFAGGLAVGTVLWGWAGDVDLPAAHLVAAGAIVVSLLAGRLWKLSPTVGVRPQAGQITDLAVVEEPASADGPVMITVSYIVPPEDEPAFVASMQTVRRHRRRSGVCRWELYRDLHRPDRFTEMFQVETWNALQLHYQRFPAAAALEVARFVVTDPDSTGCLLTVAARAKADHALTARDRGDELRRQPEGVRQ